MNGARNMDIFGTLGKLFANKAKIEREIALIKQLWLDMQPAVAKLRQEAPEIFALGRDLIAVFAPQMQQYLAGVAPLAEIRVADLQRQLQKLGYYKSPLKIDNVYGPGTTAAVRAFQKDHGLEEDGWAGMQETLPAIWTEVAKHADDLGSQPPRTAV